MKLSKTAISGFVVASLFISAPAFGATKAHKKAVVAKKVIVIKKGAPTPAVNSKVFVPEELITTLTSNVATSFAFKPEADGTVSVSDLLIEAPGAVQIPVGAPMTSQVLDSIPEFVQLPVPVVTTPITTSNPSVSRVSPVCGNSIPVVGQSCTYTPAPTTQTTSQVLAPNTIGFATQPTNGQQSYTPVVQTGTPENGAVTISVSGSATSDGSVVTFTGNGLAAITASQPGSAPVTQTIQISGVSDV